MEDKPIIDYEIIGSTTKCIVCLKDADSHTGHVVRSDGHILAGWCAEHNNVTIENNGEKYLHFNNSNGCFGGWLESYGFELEKL